MLPFFACPLACLPAWLRPTGAASGNSPGFGVALVAETTSGCLISAEACAASRPAAPRQLPQGRDGTTAAAGGGLLGASEEEAALLTLAASVAGEGHRSHAAAPSGQLLGEQLLVPEDVGRLASQVWGAHHTPTKHASRATWTCGSRLPGTTT
jgi:hypothetical protein